MPWILDTLMGRVALDISGWWHPDHDLTKANLSTWNAPDSQLLPVQIALNKAPKVLPGLTSLATKMMFATDAARAILDRFEPGKLQFSPVIVHMPNGKVYGEPIHLLTLLPPCKVDDGLVVEKSDVKLVDNYRIPAGGGTYIDGKPYLQVTRDPPQLTWSRAAVGDRHLWADSLLTSRILMSDQLYAGLKAAGITGFQAQESRFATEH